MLKLRRFPWEQNPQIIENGEKYPFNYSGGELLETDAGQNVILKSNGLNLSSIQEYADKGKKTVLLDLPFSLQEEQDQKEVFHFIAFHMILKENCLILLSATTLLHLAASAINGSSICGQHFLPN